MKECGVCTNVLRAAIATFAVAAGACSLTAMGAETAANYPARVVRMIVPFSAGSPVEIPARAVMQRLIETMGQKFVIENRPGASGTIGTELVAKAPPDGYTLLYTNCSHSSNPANYKKLPYDTLADLVPITQTNVTYGNLLVVHPVVPAHSVQEFIALAKKMPGKLSYASAGVGSPPHVTAALFNAMAGIELLHVPYKGTSVAFTDVLGGHVDVMFSSPPFTLPFIVAGKVRALGIGGPRRVPFLPDVPTFDEAGLKGFDLICYHGMFFPKGVPNEIVTRLNREVVKALATPEVKEYFTRNGLVPIGNSPEEFAAWLKNDVARQAQIAKRIGIKPQ